MQLVALSADPCPIYIDLSGSPPQAGALPWEVLFNREQDRFMALDRRWQVCRRLPSQHGETPETQLLPDPLRLFAVLTAAHVDATPEWLALSRALAALDGGGLGARLRVAVCQDGLARRVEDELAGRGEVIFVEDPVQVKRSILDFRPHLLHFFCHGTVAHGPLLQLSSKADFIAAERGLERHPVPFAEEDFAELAAPPSPIWLVTLNACRTGESGTEARALAESIAAAGFPAVVGMREEVASDDAHVFTEAFYGALLEALARFSGEPPGSELALDCAGLLLAARERLVHAHNRQALPVTRAATASKEWSLPTLYVGAGPVRLRVPPPGTGGAGLELRQELEILMRTREALARRPDPDQGAIGEIDAEIQRLLRELTGG
jgi:hypothetical protein